MFFNSVWFTNILISNFKMLSWAIIIIVSVPCEIKFRLLQTILPQTINGKELENRELIELLPIYLIYFDIGQLSVQLTMLFSLISFDKHMDVINGLTILSETHIKLK